MNNRSSVALGAALLMTTNSVCQSQTVLYVDASAGSGGDGSSWEAPLADLQAALFVAGAGSTVTEIWVVAGTYVPGGAGETDVSFELVNGVALYGGFAGGETVRDERDAFQNETILSGDLQGDDVYGVPWHVGWDIHTPNSTNVVRAVGVDASTILDGFTIRAGYATFDFGAGMYIENADPIVRHCLFTRHLTGFSHGAAMYVWNGSPSVSHCRFHENYVHLGKGGGMMIVGGSSPEITDCEFTSNICVGASPGAAGAGISNHSDDPVTVRRCRFEGNQVKNFHPIGDPEIARGGGINNFADNLVVDACTFINNDAHAGGGVYTWGGAVIVNSIFLDNTVTAYPVSPEVDHGGYGGGLAGHASVADPISVIGCTFADNHAGEAAGVSSVSGTAIVMSGCILWGNTATGEEVTTRGAQYKGAMDVFYCCVQGLLEQIPGEDPPNPKDYPGSIDEDPLLTNMIAGDVHLLPGSPCIDAADNSAYPVWVTVDAEGNPRFVDDPDTADTGLGPAPIADMGALELQIDDGVTGDLNGDGVVDAADLAILLGNWGACPDCPGDLTGDGVIDAADLALLLGNWG